MASQKNLIKLQSKETGEVYYTRKNVRKLADVKIKLKKYSPKLQKHVLFEEVKKLARKKVVKPVQAKKKAKAKSEE